MADRPILFSAPMVRALLDGRKTQTRRVAKITAIMGDRVPVYPPEELIELDDGEFRQGIMHYASTGALSGPYNIGFAVGDRLWVKETWRASYGLDFYREELGRCPRPSDMDPATTAIEYLADGERELGGKTRVSIHMPRWASRLTLTVTDVRVERLQDCSEADAIAEGIRPLPGDGPNRFTVNVEGWAISAPTAAETYRLLWNHINGAGAWEANPWVVAVTFTVEQRNIDA